MPIHARKLAVRLRAAVVSQGRRKCPVLFLKKLDASALGGVDPGLALLSAGGYREGMDLRQSFPRGLAQPEGAFRSSADALLLAGFAAPLLLAAAGGKEPPFFVDLGTGCGMAACALALHVPQALGVGVDVQPALVEAARRNVAALDMEAQLRMNVADVANVSFLRQACGMEDVQVVIANPPYRVQGQGRESTEPSRQTALQGNAETLRVFCRAARALLGHHGHCCMVFTASRLGELLTELRQNGLGTRVVRCVHTRPGRDAALVLVEARKNAAEDIRIAPPLTLYTQNEGEEHTEEARRWLFMP